MKRILALLLSLTLVCATASAQTVFYLNFDENTSSNNADATAYTPGSTEVNAAVSALLGSATFKFRNNAGDGASIGAAPGGLTGTAQGGNVLLVDSGSGQDEGIQITVDNGMAKQDFTMEAVWFTTDATGGANTAGIQAIVGNEWPLGEVSQFFIRTVGANRMDFFSDRGDSNNEAVKVETPGVVAANTWYHDVLAFDYNDSDPANSTIYAYRNGTLQGSSPYNASAASVALFAAGFGGARTLAIGYANSLDAALGDHRGLKGGVDAMALSLGLLAPGSFVLPTGNVTPFTGPTPTPSPTPGPFEYVKSGQYAAKVVNTGSWVGGADVGLDIEPSRVATVPGNQMQLKFSIRNGRTAASQLVRVVIAGFASATGGTGWTGDTNFLSGAAIANVGFQDYSFDFTVPTGANFCNVGFRPEFGGSAIVIDDIQFIDVTAGNTDLMPNGGFEDWPGGPLSTPTGYRFFDGLTTGGYVERVSVPPTGVKSTWQVYE